MGGDARSCGWCSSGKQWEVVTSANGSPGTRETLAGMFNHIKAPDPCVLSLTPFMAQVLLAT